MTKLLSLLLLCFCFPVVADWYFVSVSGSDNNSGRTQITAWKSFEHSIKQLMPGDTLFVLPGIYSEALVSIRAGEPNKPIKIVGLGDAIVRGGKEYRVVRLHHSFIQLSDIIIDSKRGKGLKLEDYRDKLIEVSSPNSDFIEGIVLSSLRLSHSYGECIRVKNNVRNSKIIGNQLQHCGLRDSRFGRGEHNTEAIYIGTAPEQLEKNQVDRSNSIEIINNKITAGVGECIDVKEGAHSNQIGHNICIGAFETETAGINIRGSDNVIFANYVTNGKGAGIRVGGDTAKNGLNNTIKQNLLTYNASGGLKIMNWPQVICENTIVQNSGEKPLRMAERYPIEPGEECND